MGDIGQVSGRDRRGRSARPTLVRKTRGRGSPFFRPSYRSWRCGQVIATMSPFAGSRPMMRSGSPSVASPSSCVRAQPRGSHMVDRKQSDQADAWRQPAPSSGPLRPFIRLADASMLPQEDFRPPAPGSCSRSPRSCRFLRARRVADPFCDPRGSAAADPAAGRDLNGGALRFAISRSGVGVMMAAGPRATPRAASARGGALMIPPRSPSRLDRRRDGLRSLTSWTRPAQDACGASCRSWAFSPPLSFSSFSPPASRHQRSPSPPPRASFRYIGYFVEYSG